MLPLHRPLGPVKDSVAVEVHTSRLSEGDTPQLIVMHINGNQRSLLTETFWQGPCDLVVADVKLLQNTFTRLVMHTQKAHCGMVHTSWYRSTSSLCGSAG